MVVRKFVIKDIEEAKSLMGVYDRNAKLIESHLGVKLSLKSDCILIEAEDEETLEKAYQVLKNIQNFVTYRLSFTSQDILDFLRFVSSQKELSGKIQEFKIEVYSKKKFIFPKTPGQMEYIRSILGYDLVFALGPAGTGKTYLAMACGVSFLKKGRVSRIILTRPAKEAGESLGFLPGDMYEKLSPYLRPLYDALYEMMEPERIEEYLDTGVIEVAPLAYMRGRTLNSSFIILDEAQNCTFEQLKMFLTRIGFDSKVVVTADPSQSDLSSGKPQGLLESVEILKGIPQIKFVYLSNTDVVRHPLVQKIIEAYERKGNYSE